MPYRVYVIEVYPRPSDAHGLLYVGSTGQSVQQRYEQHVAGEKTRWLKSREIWRLRHELVLGTKALPDRVGAEAAEAAHAETLAHLGFHTHCDGVFRRARTGDTVPAGHVARLAPLVARLTREARLATPGGIGEVQVTDLLMGEGAPPPGVKAKGEAYGRLRYLGRAGASAAISAAAKYELSQLQS